MIKIKESAIYVWYNCHICKHVCFDTNDKLEAHYKKIHKKFNKAWKSHRLILKESRVDLPYHPMKIEIKTLKNNDDQLDLKPSTETFDFCIQKEMVCKKCGQEFSYKPRYLKHLQMETCPKFKKFTCQFCQKQFDDVHKLNVHSRVHTEERPYGCYLCGHSFKQYGTLETHIFTHAGEKPFQCTYCQKRFVISYGLKIHVRGHTGQGILECETCNKTYLTRHALEMHKRTHSDKKMFTCEICNQGFNQKSHWKIHFENVHAEKPRPYRCNICREDFQYHKVLLKHLRQVHPGGRNYLCPYEDCNQTFLSHMALRVHEKYHTGKGLHSCSVCQKVFACKGKMMDHEKTHGKFYKCPECPVTFTSAIALVSHKRTHRNGDRYPCDKCEATFRVVKALRKHFSREHTFRGKGAIQRRKEMARSRMSTSMKRSLRNREFCKVPRNTEVEINPIEEMTKVDPAMLVDVNAGEINTHGEHFQSRNLQNLNVMDYEVAICETNSNTMGKTNKPLDIIYFDNDLKNPITSNNESGCFEINQTNSSQIENEELIGIDDIPSNSTPTEVSEKSATDDDRQSQYILPDLQPPSLPPPLQNPKVIFSAESRSLLKRRKELFKSHKPSKKTSIKSIDNPGLPKIKPSIQKKKKRYSEKARSFKFSDGPRICDKCGDKLTTYSAWAHHQSKGCRLSEHKLKKLKGLNPCSNCPLSFPTLTLLHNHKIQIHPEETVKRFECDICGGRFKEKQKLTAHKKIHTEEKKPMPCNICGKMLHSRVNMKRHMDIHDNPEKFKCPWCPRGFPRKDQLKSHLPFHTGDKLYKCSMCSKTFAHLSGLTLHLTLHHTREKPQKCKSCERSFTSHANLKAHVIKLHSDDPRPYKCPSCPRDFASHSGLRLHKKAHSGERPFECHVCDFKCSQNSNLQTHLKMVHFLKGEKSVQCPKCEKKFWTRSALKSHVIIHSERVKSLECSFCPKKFASKDAIMIHMRSHTKEKPYKCQFCSKSFSVSSSKKLHELLHKGIKNFKCQFCDKSYVQKGNLLSHINSFHT